jgi:hypothetical protein
VGQIDAAGRFATKLVPGGGPLHGRERQRPRVREEPGRAPEVQRRAPQGLGRTPRLRSRPCAATRTSGSAWRRGSWPRSIALAGVPIAPPSSSAPRPSAPSPALSTTPPARRCWPRFHAASPLTRLVPAQGAAVALTKDGRLVHLVPADYIPWTQPVAQAVGVAVQRAKEDFATARAGGLDHGRRQRAHEQGAGRARLEDRGGEAGAGETRSRKSGGKVMERTIQVAARLQAAASCSSRPSCWPRPAAERASTDPPRCRARAWKLDSLRSDAGLATTVDPSRYTLEFQEAFRVRAQADCNVCTGSYRTARPSSSRSDRWPARDALCGSGSRGDEYVALLNTTSSTRWRATPWILSVERRHPCLYRP